MKKHLYKTQRNRMVFGVCAGIAEEFDIDVSIIRIIWALTVCAWGTGLLFYVLCAVILPTE